jgi:flagellar biosynthetic protein FlhB
VAEESESGQEKTEEATPRRLEKAREDGQAPRSRELTTTIILLLGTGGLLIFGSQIANSMIAIMRYNLEFTSAQLLDEQFLVAHLSSSFSSAGDAILPLLILLTIAALVGPIALGGWLFSAKAMEPKFSRLDPVKGLGRMFSANALVELLKALAKFLVLSIIAIVLLLGMQHQIFMLGTGDVTQSVSAAIDMLAWAMIYVSAGMILIAAVDVPWQLFDHNKKLKMSLQEVKDEMKDTEGKPEVKGRIRQLQRQMAYRRMMEAVPQADVVITNPEHFSVALKYDVNGSSAPIVLAKGQDHVALKIREIAKKHNVIVLEAPPLARAIYFTTEIDKEIPQRLYLAVAQVLAYVFQLKAWKPGRGKKPVAPNKVEVPGDMRYDADGKVV